ncbi:class I SAM-dependent DNA methyltransferase [Shimia ponticola]|uniref:class I SAM-dependent DNA methyltransferase n=1 Tax=Shimia ponticola TaxID=2582893 RepID=UPI0011BDBBC2|nr:class I SAM-dependent methyltransferase [Shimia ponticola]
MADDPDLEGAYALNSPEAVQRLYADWAATYDNGFASTHGYQLHDHVAEAFHAAEGSGPVLDIGAGTGLVAEALSARGISGIDGTDISAEMLAVARAKGVYAHLFQSDILAGLPTPDNHYSGAVSAGTFTLGHVGPQALNEVLRVTKPGGPIVISVNTQHWEAAGFEAFLDSHRNRIRHIQMRQVPIYGPGAEHEHAADKALIVTLRPS